MNAQSGKTNVNNDSQSFPSHEAEQSNPLAQNATEICKPGELQVSFSQHPTPKPHYHWFPASFAERLIDGPGKRIVWRKAVLQYALINGQEVCTTKCYAGPCPTRAEANKAAQEICDAINAWKGTP